MPRRKRRQQAFPKQKQKRRKTQKECNSWFRQKPSESGFQSSDEEEEEQIPTPIHDEEDEQLNVQLQHGEFSSTQENNNNDSHQYHNQLQTNINPSTEQKSINEEEEEHISAPIHDEENEQLNVQEENEDLLSTQEKNNNDSHQLLQSINCPHQQNQVQHLQIKKSNQQKHNSQIGVEALHQNTVSRTIELVPHDPLDQITAQPEECEISPAKHNSIPGVLAQNIHSEEPNLDSLHMSGENRELMMVNYNDDEISFDDDFQPTFLQRPQVDENSSIGYSSTANIGLLQTRMDFICSVSTFMTVLFTTGLNRCTAKFYNFVRLLFQTYTKEISLVTFKTAQNSLWDYLRKHCLPKSNIIDLRFPNRLIDESKKFNPSHCVRIVKPSEWASIDVKTPFYHNQLIRDQPHSSGPNIFKSKMFSHRSELNCLNRVLFVGTDNTTTIARPGDHILLPVSNSCSIEGLSDWIITSKVTGNETSDDQTYIKAQLGPIWLTNTGDRTIKKTQDIIDSQIVCNVADKEKKILDKINSGRIMAYDLSQEATEKLLQDTNELSLSDISSSSKVQIIGEGDYCSFLRPLAVMKNTNVYCIFIARHIMTDTYMRSRQEVLWLSELSDSSIVLLYSETVNGFPLITEKTETSKKLDSVRIEKTGFLKNGKRYIRYPIALYHDDFQPRSSLYPHGSVGGCYFIPLSFWCRTKSCPSAARIISLTPPGQSTCKVLCLIVDDLINGIVNGIPTIDSNGEEVIIFLDLVCLIADYPAVPPTIDTNGHTANAPCTVCCFQRQKDSFDSDYGYTTFANWQNPAFSRSKERTSILRNAELSQVQMTSIGLKDIKASNWKQIPLFLFSDEIHRRKEDINAVVNEDNIPINNSYLDPYMATVEAPDHCLMGLIKNCIDSYFFCLENDKVRSKVDLMTVASLVENGLPRQTSIYNIKKKKMHSMSMSSTFSVFLILEALASNFIDKTKVTDQLLLIMSTLQLLIRNLYWWPNPILDGQQASAFSSDSGLERLSKECQNTVCFLIDSVNRLSTMDKTIGSFMDKPNLHRLLELCHHSVFAFGHTRNIAEMGLETVHQILKGSLRGNNNLDKHLTAIHHAICADWQTRIIEGFNNIVLENDKKKQLLLLKGQAILMLGSAAKSLDVSDNAHQLFLLSFYDRLKKMLPEPFRSYILKQISFNVEQEYENRKWIGLDHMKEHDLVNTQKMLQGVSMLRKYYSRLDYECYATSALTRRSGDKTGRVYPYHKVRYGNCIQVCTAQYRLSKEVVLTSGENTPFKVEDNNNEGGNTARKTMSFFAVHGFIQQKGQENLFAVAQRLKRSETPRSFKLSNGSVQLVQMSGSIRRVGMIHICQSCKVNAITRKVFHSQDIFNNGHFILLPRSSGFPPRMA